MALANRNSMMQFSNELKLTHSLAYKATSVSDYLLGGWGGESQTKKTPKNPQNQKHKKLKNG